MKSILKALLTIIKWQTECLFYRSFFAKLKGKLLLEWNHELIFPCRDLVGTNRVSKTICLPRRRTIYLSLSYFNAVDRLLPVVIVIVVVVVIVVVGVIVSVVIIIVVLSTLFIPFLRYFHLLIGRYLVQLHLQLGQSISVNYISTFAVRA